MIQETPLGKFGQFITEKLRDNSIQFAEDVLEGKYKSHRLIALQQRLSTLDENQKRIALDFAKTIIRTGIHDFLFALVERSDIQGDINILVDGKDIIQASDGIHGEAYGEDGWYAKYSKYGEVDD